MAGWSCTDAALTEVAEAIAAAIETESSVVPEPAYHNRHHFAEAVIAMDLLCRTACALSLLPQHLADLGVLAMIGHDLGHDGGLPPPGTLEARAACRVSALARRLDPADQAVLTHVILATNPLWVPSNLARARGADATVLDRLTALANEADVMASLLPMLGLSLSERLAEEWRPHDPARARFASSFVGRRQFLSTYAAPTRAAQALGLEHSIARQIQAITPDLDLMPRADALLRYRAALGVEEPGWRTV